MPSASFASEFPKFLMYVVALPRSPGFALRETLTGCGLGGFGPLDDAACDPDGPPLNFGG